MSNFIPVHHMEGCAVLFKFGNYQFLGIEAVPEGEMGFILWGKEYLIK